MDFKTFPAFEDFLKATEEYAQRTGFRFSLRDFTNSEKTPTVNSFVEKVRSRDPAILQDIARAHKVSEQEGIRNVMHSTCKELELWPPASEDRLQSMAYTDVSEPLDNIAWALYNYDRSLDESEGVRMDHEAKCRTASYLVDFAHSVGERLEMSKAGSELLIQFLERAKEWADTHNIKGVRIRSTVMQMLSEFADESYMREIDEWLDKHWEAVAIGTFALVAGFAIAALAFGSRNRK